MELRILGAHNLESRDSRMESHLIDGVLALDAGSLTRALTFEEQRGIKAIILSHRHYDHVRDLLPLGLVVRNAEITIDIYAMQDTMEFVSDKLLDGSLYPNFLNTPSPENPTYRLHIVDFYKKFKVLDYTAMAVPVPHSVPAAGFEIVSDSVRLFYTGDTGRGLSDSWQHVSPEVLLTEVTFGNDHEENALFVGHLTPRLLTEELVKFKEVHDYMTRVIVAHMNPPWEAVVRKELKSVADDLGVDILVSRSDMTVTL